ncbi:Ulp1 peptidase [Malassezia vespertilionis]|uniref:Ubiquitin-like protease family profile domain-containing protein n=1 Tax=Malassezia vespertilionis TaxID=2020962 RepID=A0A2N1JDH0_9BASI|nr:Ulp1 peptidase [Malassezia vespertilionis]PKI84583.1 hypothetical protein MVES_001751 [Malassezia vespertilionis]WFD06504.1 Ulp1 peptidase [Malassezia vespertilionis]
MEPLHFYADATPSPSHKRVHEQEMSPSIKQSKTPAPGADGADDSRDELDFLSLASPAKPLRERMRKRDVPSATPGAAHTMQSISIPLRVLYINQEWYSDASDLQLVSFSTHFAVLCGASELLKIALRDIHSWKISSSEHKLLVLAVGRGETQARLARLVLVPPPLPIFHIAFLPLTTDAWGILVDRVRYSPTLYPGELIPEPGAKSLCSSWTQRNTTRLFSEHAPRKPVPVAVGEHRAATHGAQAPQPTTLYTPIPHPTRKTRAATRVEEERRASELDKPILRYPAHGPYAVTLLGSDVERLNEHEFLNDTLIEFGLRFIMEQVSQRDPHLASQIHLFNSFFFMKLNEYRDRSKSYEQVRKWTNRVNIFDKEMLIVPINENMHWYVAIVVNPRGVLGIKDHGMRLLRRTSRHGAEHEDGERSLLPSTAAQAGETYVLVLDSLGSTHVRVKNVLRDYLRLEARDKQRVPEDVDLRRLGDPIHVDVQVPTQPNSCDCGIYLLHNMECFLSDPATLLPIALGARRGADKTMDAAWNEKQLESRRAYWKSAITKLGKRWREGQAE